MDEPDFRVCKVTIMVLVTAVFNNANFEIQTFTFIFFNVIIFLDFLVTQLAIHLRR